MRVGIVGSFPPAKDGISDHNQALFDALRKHHPELVIIKLSSDSNFSKERIEALCLDVIHLQLGNSYANSFVFRAFNSIKYIDVKMIVTVHDLQDAAVPRFIRALLESPKSLVDDFHRPKLGAIFDRSVSVIVYSAYARKVLRSRYREHSSKIKVIMHGGSTFSDKAYTSVNKKDRQNLIITSYGYITPRKGYEQVILALKDLEERDVRYTYQLMGKFNFIHYAAYIHSIRRLYGLVASIQLLGHVSNSDAELRLVNADIIVLPRKYSNEGASGSITKALFSGTPIIAAKTGGFSEYIINNETGILVEHRASAYEDAINRLAKDKRMRERLGRNALSWAKRNIEWSKIAIQHSKEYQDVTNRSL